MSTQTQAKMRYVQSNIEEGWCDLYHDGIDYRIEIDIDELRDYGVSSGKFEEVERSPFGFDWGDYQETTIILSLEEYIERYSAETLIMDYIEGRLKEFNIEILEA